MDESYFRFRDAACDKFGAYVVVDIEAGRVGSGEVRKKELSQAVLAGAFPSGEDLRYCAIEFGAWRVGSGGVNEAHVEGGFASVGGYVQHVVDGRVNVARA